jgi:short-subunit dehydrogenase
VSQPRALVTGASSGIGLAIARRLAAEGYDLVVCAEDPSIHHRRAELERNGVEVTPVRADLRDPAAVDDLYSIASAPGALDVVALNAGVGVGGGTFGQTSLQNHLDVVRLDVVSTVQLAGLVIPDLVRRRAGRLLFTASLVAEMAGPYQTTYNASKAFVANFAAGLRYELKHSGVTVTTLLPGPVQTAFFARAGMGDTALGRMGKEQPDLVARQAVRALLRGRSTVIGGRLIALPSAALITALPQPARTWLQALLSRPVRRA